jgi:hypothetical protein
LRAYVSTFVTQVGYPHRDNFGSEGALRLLERARRTGDRRVLRFLGAEDEEAIARTEAAWALMIEQEALERRQQAAAAAAGRGGGTPGRAAAL